MPVVADAPRGVGQLRVVEVVGEGDGLKGGAASWGGEGFVADELELLAYTLVSHPHFRVLSSPFSSLLFSFLFLHGVPSSTERGTT